MMFREMDAIDTEEQVLLWRFSTGGWDDDKVSYAQKSRPISFSDNILAGYILDGMLYSDITEGLTNFSACTMSYYDIHTQAIAASAAGHIGGRTIENLPSHYQEYIANLGKHQIYALQMDYAKAAILHKKGYLSAPMTTESSAVCFQKGEAFHPMLSPHLYKDATSLQEVESYVIPFYLGSAGIVSKKTDAAALVVAL